MTIENHAIRGAVRLALVRPDGSEAEVRSVRNKITAAGRNLAARYLVGGQEAKPRLSLVVGTSGAEFRPEDYALGVPSTAEGDGGWVLKEPADAPSVDGGLAAITATFAAVEEALSFPLREAGILIEFPDAEGIDPVLYNRATFDVVTKDPTMALTLRWEVRF